MFESRFCEQRHGEYRFVREGAPGRAVLLLHGMIGGPGNWDVAVDVGVRAGYEVVVPHLPVFSLPRDQSTVRGMSDWVLSFMDSLGIGRSVVIGNSLGGHVAALIAIRHPDRVGALGLVGSSGVHEVDMGVSPMRRRDRNFIRDRARLTFHDPKHVTEQLVDNVMETIADRTRALRLIRLARSAKLETVTDSLASIAVPTLVVWGKQDYVTPPDVAETLDRLVPDTRLHLLDECGHAPMMEHPETFGAILGGFLSGLNGAV